MKITRYKKANKRINFYINNFGYRAPIQVLIDGTFCFAAFKVRILINSTKQTKISQCFDFQNKFNIEEQLKSYLQLELRFLTTPCLIIETEKLGSKLIPATKKLKDFVLNKCGHEKSPLSGSECIKDLCKKSHYVIATQDRDLQEWIRRQCGIALLYLHQIVPVLEEPSEKSRKFIESQSKTTATVSQLEVEKLEYFKKKEGLVQEAKPMKKKKKKGGPNPLSMKKKKPKDDTSRIKKKTIDKKNIKKKRIKIPKHVKEILKKKIK